MCIEDSVSGRKGESELALPKLSQVSYEALINSLNNKAYLFLQVLCLLSLGLLKLRSPVTIFRNQVSRSKAVAAI